MSLLVALVLAPLALAEPDGTSNPFTEPDESELFRLDEQLVTVASRYAQTIRKAPSIVTLVTADQIRQRGYRTLSDALRQIPGIYVWKTPEGRDIASVRGVVSADNNKILVLIDGVPWYDGVYTHSSIDDYLPLSHVKQIEVIKGPGSAIYGTNAFAGIVNVVTLGADDVDGMQVRAMVGAVGRTDITAVVGGRDDVGGIPVKATAYARVFNQYGDGPDSSPRDRPNILGNDPKAGIAVGGRVEVAQLTLSVHHIDHRLTYMENSADDPYSIANKDPDQFTVGFNNTFFEARYRWESPIGVDITPYLNSQRHDNPGNYFYSKGFRTSGELNGGRFQPYELQGLSTHESIVTVETEKDTRRWGTGFDLQARPGLDHIVVGGLGADTVHILGLFDREFEYDPAISGSAHIGVPSGFEATTDAALWNAFAYGQWTWTALPELEVTAGGRLDYRLQPVGLSPEEEAEGTDAFLPVVSPRIGLLWVPSEAVTAKLLYGRAFRAPSVRELLVHAPADDDDPTQYQFSNGNLSVAPETIQTVEAEVSAILIDGIEARVSGSWSDLRNEIDKVTPPLEYQNLITPLNVVGTELSLRVDQEPISFDATYNFTMARYGTASDPTDPRAAFTGRQQYEFPPHMAKGGVGLDLTENLGAWLGGEFYGRRPRADWSPDANMADGPAFGLMHLGVRASDLGSDDRVNMNISVRNLLDVEWGTGSYRDNANIPLSGSDPATPKFPNGFEGEGRSVHVGLEIKL